MSNKKRRRFGLQLDSKLRFVHSVLAGIILIAFLNACFSVRLLEEEKFFPGWNTNAFMIQFAFVVIGLVFLVTLVYILHYGFGATIRMERILEEVAKGNYSLRINLRKKDIMKPLAEKMNRVLDLLEKK